ncbi:MAG: D-alanyl-D-alanine carboxypeptidase, partial [Spirochaetia bacterium]|nr:D-alanyl-D-alanine carboxypeptidase [Spirochaetia bacterium]
MNSLKKYIFYSLILTLILFQSATHGFGSKTIQIGPNPQNDLSHEEAHKNFPHIRPDQTGFILYDLSNNRVVAAHNRNQLFIPASTTKILTVAASLHLLGPEHQFKTILSRSGSIHQGVLKGNLYLTGGGDPDLGINDLLQMIREMKQKGIRKVDGKFIFDNSRYEESHEIDEIMDDEAAYNTGISALSLGTNNLIAFWKKSSYRGPTNFFLIPSLSMNEVRNKKYKKKENIESEYIGENNREIWMLSPRNANSGLKFLPVKNPSLFTAQVFKKLSEIEGISLPQPEKGRTPWHSFSIHQVKSRTVLEISRTILATSNNTMTENLLLSLAAERGIQNP